MDDNLRWRPRWTRLQESPAEADSTGRVAAPGDERVPSDGKWMVAGVKSLAGPVGALAAVIVVAALLWHATGLLIETWLRPKPGASVVQTRNYTAPTLTSPTAIPTSVRSAAPTLAPTVITVIEAAPTQTAAAPPTSQPPTSQPPSPAPPSPTAAPPPPTAVPTTAPPPAPTAAPRPAVSDEHVHTVERGDTLFSIARRNGTTVGALVSANGLPSADAVLPVGRRLVIP
jgi:LysM repeat protein